jgi:hypothetical protein
MRKTTWGGYKFQFNLTFCKLRRIKIIWIENMRPRWKLPRSDFSKWWLSGWLPRCNFCDNSFANVTAHLFSVKFLRCILTDFYSWWWNIPHAYLYFFPDILVDLFRQFLPIPAFFNNRFLIAGDWVTVSNVHTVLGCFNISINSLINPGKYRVSLEIIFASCWSTLWDGPLHMCPAMTNLFGHIFFITLWCLESRYCVSC